MCWSRCFTGGGLFDDALKLLLVVGAALSPTNAEDAASLASLLGRAPPRIPSLVRAARSAAGAAAATLPTPRSLVDVGRLHVVGLGDAQARRATDKGGRGWLRVFKQHGLHLERGSVAVVNVMSDFSGKDDHPMWKAARRLYDGRRRGQVLTVAVPGGEVRARATAAAVFSLSRSLSLSLSLTLSRAAIHVRRSTCPHRSAAARSSRRR